MLPLFKNIDHIMFDVHVYDRNNIIINIIHIKHYVSMKNTNYQI